VAYNPNPALVAAIKRRTPDPQFQSVLLATALAESGGRLDAIGDNGNSGGPYQENSAGRGHGIPMPQRFDPVASTDRAAREFSRYRTSDPGVWAARAQRPADPTGYAAKVRSLLPVAQGILGSQAGASRAAGAPAVSGGFDPGSMNRIASYLAQSEKDVLAGREPADIMPLLSKLKFRTPATDPTPTPGGINAAGTGATIAVKAAQSQLGVPYSWGGGSPTGPTRGFGRGANTVGFDCSSLVQFAWAKSGVKIPRTTYEQVKVGRPVPSLAQAAPGDLLFSRPGPRGPEHVQMYLGNGQVLHAPRTGGKVEVRPIDREYIAIRRPG
jgi:cell wall-associated NlpC family hydrolase